MSDTTDSLGKARLADKLGLEFRHTASYWEFYADPPWERFEAFGFLRNILQGEWRGHDVRIFDFERKSGDYDSPSYYSTAICIASDRIKWPRTFFAGYGQMDWFADKLFGDTRIVPNSKCDPQFVVDSDDPKFDGLVDSRLDKFLRLNGDLEIHVSRGKLAICTSHKHQLSDVELESYMEKSEELLEIVTTPLRTGPASELGSAGSILVRNQRSRMGRLGEVLFLSLVLLFCGFHLHHAWLQWNASKSFVETEGWMTKVEFDDGMLTDMQYEYIVAGKLYKGGKFNRRFVWRPIRRGDERARQLVQDWQQGARPAVFHDPKQAHHSVLDNTFTKGDKNFTKLLLAIGGGCFCWLGVRLMQTLISFLKSTDQSTQRGYKTKYALPFAPFTVDFAALLVLPLGALLIAWVGTLVSDIAIFDSIWFWSSAVAIMQAILIPFLLVVERNWRGANSRYVTIDHQLGMITIPRAGSTAVTVEFQNLRSIRLRATVRDPETVSGMNGYDPIVTYVDNSGKSHDVVITRFFSEKKARQLVNAIRALIDQHVPKEIAKSPERKLSPTRGFAAQMAEAVTVEQLSNSLMVLAGLMAILLLTRQVEIAIALIVAVAVGVAWFSIALSLEVGGNRSKWFRSCRDTRRKTTATRSRNDDVPGRL